MERIERDEQLFANILPQDHQEIDIADVWLEVAPHQRTVAIDADQRVRQQRGKLLLDGLDDRMHACLRSIDEFFFAQRSSDYIIRPF